RLADSFHLIYYDQRGRGKSADKVRPADVSLASDVDDIDTLREHFHLQTVTVVRTFLGNRAGARVCARPPSLTTPPGRCRTPGTSR
ncbi:MAG TPA: hypothetical protein VL484_17140, partial [Vicinamibacterales bacterium]|nr:hypothetical protein [Vicinamibacterales bacterium]